MGHTLWMGSCGAPVIMAMEVVLNHSLGIIMIIKSVTSISSALVEIDVDIEGSTHSATSRFRRLRA